MQIPISVLDCIREHYVHHNANIHRGIHLLSEESTTALENAREIVAGFLGAASAGEIVFTQGCTNSINLVARGLASQIQSGDEIIVSALEHHSNFVPLQQLCLEKSAKFHVIPVPDGCLDMDAYSELHGRYSLAHSLAVLGVSNVKNSTKLQ